MTTHGAVSFIVHEENTEIRCGTHRRCKDTAVHFSVTPRLPHQHRSQVIEVFLQVPASLQHGLTGQVRKAARHDSQRFTLRVRIERRDAEPAGRDLPVAQVLEIQSMPLSDDQPDALIASLSINDLSHSNILYRDPHTFEEGDIVRPFPSWLSPEHQLAKFTPDVAF